MFWASFALKLHFSLPFWLWLKSKQWRTKVLQVRYFLSEYSWKWNLLYQLTIHFVFCTSSFNWDQCWVRWLSSSLTFQNYWFVVFVSVLLGFWSIRIHVLSTGLLNSCYWSSLIFLAEGTWMSKFTLLRRITTCHYH